MNNSLKNYKNLLTELCSQDMGYNPMTPEKAMAWAKTFKKEATSTKPNKNFDWAWESYMICEGDGEDIRIKIKGVAILILAIQKNKGKATFALTQMVTCQAEQRMANILAESCYIAQYKVAQPYQVALYL